MSSAFTLAIPHRFIVPAEAAGISGGNLYNRELLAALERAGARAGRLDLREAREASKAAAPARYWLDTLYLDQFRSLRAVLPRGSFGMLVHYLPSLVTLGGAIARDALTSDERTALDQADAFVVTSHWMREALERLGCAERPLLVVEPGRPEAPGGVRPAPAAGVRALIVANLVPGKGVEPFLGALAAELRDADGFELTIVGGPRDAAYAARCRALVAEDPRVLRRVTFAGELSPDATLARLARSNLFISASHFEAYGMALSEARVTGLPILALATGNTPALVDSASGGELFGSERELARAALGLCRHPERHQQRLENAQRARPPSRPWSEAALDFIAQARRLAGSKASQRGTPANGTTSETPERTTR